MNETREQLGEPVAYWPLRGPAMVRLAIIDDSPLRRTALAYVLNHTGRYSVVGHAPANPFVEHEARTWAIDGAVIAVSQAGETIAAADTLLARFTGLAMVGCVIGKLEPEKRRYWATKTKALLPASTELPSLLKVLDAFFQLRDPLAHRTPAGLALTEADFATLSGREKEIMALMGCALQPKMIAARLGLSHNTVYAHMEHMRLKLRLPNMHHMVQAACLFAMLYGPPEK
jgi:DNA-binding NarL/FixJ family response regulator